MTSNTLYSSSLWRIDVIIFAELNKPPPPQRGLKYIGPCGRYPMKLAQSLNVARARLLISSTQREYSSKPLKNSIVERILVFKR